MTMTQTTYRGSLTAAFAPSPMIKLLSTIALLALVVPPAGAAASPPLERIRPSDDGTHFIGAESGQRFVVWGVNYDHDGSGRLLDEYWFDEWETVVEDFQEIKSLGANCVRVHLQLGKFMSAPDQPNQRALDRLAKLVRLAERTQLYLDVTGLACYHRENVPTWYDAMSEKERWAVQAVFWQAVAKTCADSPAIFCYDLMNEPVLPGKDGADQWLTGELGGKFFVQRLTLDLAGRTREEIAQAWVRQMVDAIRMHDTKHMITVGVIPWVFVFGGGQPLFHRAPVGDPLDFVAVHFYPRRGEVDKAVEALAAYDLGKPLLVEETFPLRCGIDELARFIEGSSDRVDGWISFYWGTTAQQLRRKEDASIAETLTARWLTRFEELSSQMATQP